jgi:hypothetical protein
VTSVLIAVAFGLAIALAGAGLARHGRPGYP